MVKKRKLGKVHKNNLEKTCIIIYIKNQISVEKYGGKIWQQKKKIYGYS